MNDDITIPYSELIDGAMRGVIYHVLKQIGKDGLAGDHHFYITFMTEYPGVAISDTLKSRYPSEMTIVLQHQFWDFEVTEEYFHVTLSFGGVPESLHIPFAALTAFADPSVKFGLQFQKMEASDETLPVPLDYEQVMNGDQDGVEAVEADEDSSAEIISLDSFRKK